jgi:hypothetical protein
LLAGKRASLARGEKSCFVPVRISREKTTQANTGGEENLTGEIKMDVKDLEANEEAAQDYVRIAEEAEEEEFYDWF